MKSIVSTENSTQISDWIEKRDWYKSINHLLKTLNYLFKHAIKYHLIN